MPWPPSVYEKGSSIIVESVAPGCAEGSRFGADIKAARDAIDTKFGAITGRKTLLQTAIVTGVGSFDHIHSQEGVAPNGIELHPILDIAFHDKKDHTALRRRVHTRKEED